jgi:nucleoside-diphosphate-sugar epimerase
MPISISDPPAARAKRLFCFGLGYSATALAERLMVEGWSVAGTCRDAAKAKALAARGIRAVGFAGGQADEALRAALAQSTHLVSSVPPDAEGDPVLRHYAAEIAAAPGLAWVGYLSTTGVYGDRKGGWVDEGSTLEPTGERGQRRVTAEAAWLALGSALGREQGLPAHIFRLAGIYGPGRSALDQARAGLAKRVATPGQVFSRIHVEDIAAALAASMARPNPGAVYNVCDDNPAPSEEVVAYACGLLGLPTPPLLPLEAAELSPMAASFYRDNKRVSNQRIKRELGIVLRYPDYRAGLKAILHAGG